MGQTGNFFPMPYAPFPMPKNSIPLWVEFFIMDNLADMIFVG
ncbi:MULTISPECIES: hypothetical protein [unclassified Nostoc]|nr:hypothetical protein [Nostoc sp. S13]MDF5734607.1 hypothetical protein [Nostoc sp. S13]